MGQGDLEDDISDFNASGEHHAEVGIKLFGGGDEEPWQPGGGWDGWLSNKQRDKARESSNLKNKSSAVQVHPRARP